MANYSQNCSLGKNSLGRGRIHPASQTERSVVYVLTMDTLAIEKRALPINRYIGMICGIWMRQNKSHKIVVRIMWLSLGISATIVQIANITKEYSFRILLKQTPYLITAFVGITKYAITLKDEDKMSHLLSGIVSDWQTARPKEEMQILESHTKKSVILSVIYTVILFSCSFSYGLLPIMPRIMDLVAPLNESRGRVLLYPSYYFVDEDKYYYFIIGHEMMCALASVLSYIMYDMNLVSTVQHGCALLDISGYRFKLAVDERYHYTKTKDNSYVRMCRSIDSHKRAIEYIREIEEFNDTILFTVVTLMIILLSSVLLQLSNVELTYQYVALCIFMVGQVGQMFFLNIVGQWVKNANEENFQEICKMFWYNAPPNTKLLYLLVLEKCMSPPDVTAGGFLELSLNTFMQILKVSFSYYTVLKSSF